MASSKDCFTDSGPIHMVRPGSCIDWKSEEHRRCVAACLIQGTNVLERDRMKSRSGARALAPAWYESFRFRVVCVLEDDGGKIVFGAIYEHAAPRHPSAPQYVVAFRGTILRHLRDLSLDARILVNRLKGSKRFQRAYAAVDALPAEREGELWLAGHSLGASLALEVGRTKMTEQGLGLPTFLFNPPQVSWAPAIDMLHLTELHTLSHLFKAGLGLSLCREHRERMEMVFQRLLPWEPRLYVHGKDIICQGFIDYFEQREQLEKRFGGPVRSATTLSYRDMLFYGLLGKDKEQPHLLPSATLCKNSRVDTSAPWFRKWSNSHKLRQWWKPDGELSLSLRHYRYPAQGPDPPLAYIDDYI